VLPAARTKSSLVPETASVHVDAVSAGVSVWAVDSDLATVY
jgi:hypothetical protein